MSRTFVERAPPWLLLGWLLITMGWWALAFAKISGASPEWLAVAQSVCFGNLENGLPDTYGWVTLIVPPLAMLATLLTVHWVELRPALRKLWGAAAGKAALAVLLAAVLLHVGWVTSRVREGLRLEAALTSVPAKGMFPPGYPRLDRAAPDFSLVDQNGAQVRLSDFRGKVVYLTFAFGHCGSTCPVTIRSMLIAALQAREAPTPILVVTLDPWRDTPGSLGTLSRKWELGGVGHILSGRIEEVLQVLQTYQIPRARDLLTGDISHPALVYVIDPAGMIAYALVNPSPRWIAAAGERAAAAATPGS